MNIHSQLLARRMHTLRVARDWSPDRLAVEVAQHGAPWTRSVVVNIENNRRDAMTVDEMFAVAAAFGIPAMTFFVDAAFLGVLAATVQGEVDAEEAEATDEEGDVPGAE